MRLASSIAAVTNLLASAAMLFFLRPALDPKNSLEIRFRSLVDRPGIWTASWLLWIFAAVGLILFLIHWAIGLDRSTLGRWRAWIVFGALIGCLGLIPDTIAETFYLGIFPKLAHEALHSLPGDFNAVSLKFREWENVTSMLTGFLGNGLYCLGGITLQIVALRCGALPRFSRYFGFLVWLSGFGLSWAAIAENTAGLFAFTALAMGSFVLWSASLAVLPYPEPPS